MTYIECSSQQQASSKPAASQQQASSREKVAECQDTCIE